MRPVHTTVRAAPLRPSGSGNELAELDTVGRLDWTFVVVAGLLVAPACDPDTCSGEERCREEGAYRCDGPVMYRCTWVTTSETNPVLVAVDDENADDECRELVWHQVDCSDPLTSGCAYGPKCNEPQ